MRSSNVGARRYGRLAAVLLALLASGCSLETDRPGIGIRPIFDTSADPLPEPDVAPTVSVEVNPVGLITTRGQFVAICPRGVLDARYGRQGENLTVHIFHQPPGDCAQAPDPILLDYIVVLTNVPSGTYHFSVVHEGDRQVANGTAVAERDVTIP